MSVNTIIKKDLNLTDVIHDLCENWENWLAETKRLNVSMYSLLLNKYPTVHGLGLALESVWFVKFNKKYYKSEN